jgi:polysaccharide biosynthesis transport protein
MSEELPMDTKAEESREVTEPRPSDEQWIYSRTCSRWGAALLLALALAVVGGGLAFLFWTPTYEAVACLKIEAHPRHIAFEMKGEDGDSSENFIKTQVNLLRHPVVLRPVLANPEIARMPEIAAQSDPVKWLGKQITVKSEDDSELYDVSFAASDPKAAATVVNSLLDEYFRLRGREDAGRSAQVIEALELELNKRGLEVKNLREIVRELNRQVGGKPNQQVDRTLADLQNRLAIVEAEQAVLKAEIEAYQKAAAREEPVSDAMIQNKIDMHPDVLRIKGEITGLQTQLQELDSGSKRGAKDPAYEQITQQIQKNQKLLTQLRNDLQKQFRMELQSTAAAKRDEKITALQTELERRRIIAEKLRELCDSQTKDAKPNGGDPLQLRFKQGELDRAEKVYGIIAQRIVELSTEARAPERVVIIQKAVVSETPVEKVPYGNILLASLTGFCLPFLGLIVISALSWLISVCFPVVKRRSPRISALDT